MIERLHYRKAIERALGRSRAVALLGPRQCGKTTLARQFVDARSPNYFDLEDPAALQALEDPKTALEPLTGLVVIDEVQRRPDIFPIFRVLLDRAPLPAQFLILGSASPDLLQQSTESLAGRIELIEMGGFTQAEAAAGAEAAAAAGAQAAAAENLQARLWNRGGFPLSYLAANDEDSLAWRTNFIRAFLERDLRQHQGIDAPALSLHRFWTMLAHSHGQVWNAAPFAASLGWSQPTVRKYLDIMSGLYILRQLQPWHANIKKRQVKSPKVYVRDAGLLHALLGIGSAPALLRHPACGASWEGFVMEEVIRAVQPEAAHYWAVHQGAEIDLLLHKGGKMHGVEIKRQDAPEMTASIKTALDCLPLEGIAVIYPGARRYALHKKVAALPFTQIAEDPAALFGAVRSQH